MHSIFDYIREDENAELCINSTLSEGPGLVFTPFSGSKNRLRIEIDLVPILFRLCSESDLGGG